MTSFKESKVGKVAIDVASSSIYAFFMLYRFCEDQVDNIRNMRNSPPKQEDNPAPAPTFKEQLDREAVESRAHDNEEGNSVVKTIVDKSKLPFWHSLQR
ncbi:hypothetical protein TARUN_603 [Trichoderma arundinaceum]|uniref:Uncharacterized protein n=1 Tax=Trichoderma arundinaceum TaxID=490622 RepID=A0A395NZR7_TRIAR|nr:hypothetical protein TARUN_603 [Trichoderma arundinaceum]